MARGLGFPSVQYGLWVSWSRPGVIRLGYFKSALAVVHEGTAFFLGEESMFPVTEIAERLGPKKNDFQTAQAIRQVLTEMRTGHGGTLLVLPNRSYAKDAFSESFLSGPQGDQLELLANQLAMRVGGVNTPVVTVALAHLANHDGALVITKGLGLVSAGSKIAVEDSPPTVLQMIPTNPVQKKLVPPAELGGTRHQSACRFVWKYREAVAFVVSSDGPVTVMHFDGEQVVATKHFEWLLDSETVT